MYKYIFLNLNNIFIQILSSMNYYILSLVNIALKIIFVIIIIIFLLLLFKYCILKLVRFGASYRIIENLQSRHVPPAKFIIPARFSSVTGHASGKWQVTRKLHKLSNYSNIYIQSIVSNILINELIRCYGIYKVDIFA